MSTDVKCVVAACSSCSGLKGIETELDNQETVDRWFDRGDVLSKQPLSVAKAMKRCGCRSAA